MQQCSLNLGIYHKFIQFTLWKTRNVGSLKTNFPVFIGMRQTSLASRLWKRGFNVAPSRPTCSLSFICIFIIKKAPSSWCYWPIIHCITLFCWLNQLKSNFLSIKKLQINSVNFAASITKAVSKDFSKQCFNIKLPEIKFERHFSN